MHLQLAWCEYGADCVVTCANADFSNKLKSLKKVINALHSGHINHDGQICFKLGFLQLTTTCSLQPSSTYINCHHQPFRTPHFRPGCGQVNPRGPVTKTHYCTTTTTAPNEGSPSGSPALNCSVRNRNKGQSERGDIVDREAKGYISQVAHRYGYYVAVWVLSSRVEVAGEANAVGKPSHYCYAHAA